MTDSETIKANFPFPIIPREPGLPTFQIVNDVHNKSKANAASISSSLGGGPHRLLGLSLSPATYHQITGYHFIRPTNPGALPQNFNGTAVVMSEQIFPTQGRASHLPPGRELRPRPQIPAHRRLQQNLLPGPAESTHGIFWRFLPLNDLPPLCQLRDHHRR